MVHDTTLLQLSIAHNDLHDDGVIAISDCLKTNTTLQQLSMTTDTISDKVTNMLSTALTGNEALHTLTIEDGYSVSFHDTILSAMYGNSTMMKLTLPTTTEEKCCVLRNEVEKINILRRSQEINMLNVIFFEDLSDSFQYDLYSSS